MNKKSSIYLEKDFRNLLFSRAYENAGGSLGAMALEIGYRGKGRNGPVRNMWLGTISVSAPKIEKIAKLARLPIQNVKNHIVSREQNVEITNWNQAYEEYKNKSIRKPSIA